MSHVTHPVADVLVWTNDHVISWAESIGLSEYAPNLKESGVHGGSIALDNDFDCEKLALALRIPPTILEVGSRDLSCGTLPMPHVQWNTEHKMKTEDALYNISEFYYNTNSLMECCFKSLISCFTGSTKTKSRVWKPSGRWYSKSNC